MLASNARVMAINERPRASDRVTAAGTTGASATSELLRVALAAAEPFREARHPFPQHGADGSAKSARALRG